MRGTNFSALVSSMDTVSRSPTVCEGPLKAAWPALSAATSTRPISVSTHSVQRHATRRILRLRRLWARVSFFVLFFCMLPPAFSGR